MKTINLREVLVTLSESEMKKVTGGGDFLMDDRLAPDDTGGGAYPCQNKKCKKNSDCSNGLCSTSCSSDPVGTKRCA